MSDTPETDAHSPASYAIIGPDGVRTDYVPADFARKLERQRNNLQDQRDFAMSEIGRLEQERDQARNLADAAMWEADRLRAQLRKEKQ